MTEITVSMLQSVQSRRHLEVEAIQGHLCPRGRAARRPDSGNRPLLPDPRRHGRHLRVTFAVPDRAGWCLPSCSPRRRSCTATGRSSRSRSASATSPMPRPRRKRTSSPAGLARLGVRHGDRVLLMMRNRAEFVLSWLGGGPARRGAGAGQRRLPRAVPRASRQHGGRLGADRGGRAPRRRRRRRPAARAPSHRRRRRRAARQLPGPVETVRVRVAARPTRRTRRRRRRPLRHRRDPFHLGHLRAVEGRAAPPCPRCTCSRSGTASCSTSARATRT